MVFFLLPADIAGVIGQVQVDTSGIFIPNWALGLLAAVVTVFVLPWAAWATSTIFDLKKNIDLSNNTDKNIYDKLDEMEETIKTNNTEIRNQLKDINLTLNSFISEEFHFMKRLIRGDKNED